MLNVVIVFKWTEDLIDMDLGKDGVKILDDTHHRLTLPWDTFCFVQLY